MNHATDIAKYTTEIAVGLAAFSTGAATGIGPIAVAGAALAAIGVTIWKSSANRACEKAVKDVMADMQGSPGITDETLEHAAKILRDGKPNIQLDPAKLARLARGGEFSEKATEFLLNKLGLGLASQTLSPQDYEARSILEIAFGRALAVCSSNDAFDANLKRQLLLDAARDHGVTLTLLDSIKADTTALRDGQSDHTAMLTELLHRVGGFQQAVATAESLALADLRTLAAAFGHFAADDKPALVNFLTLKAEEYVTYRATIDGLDDRVAAIANLKGAALHAADTLNFDEVEMLLSRVDEVETEIAAETKLARAQNALMQNNPTRAFHILTAAADSFASIDPSEPARRRILAYFTILRNHGLRYGGAGLPLSARLLDPVLTDDLKHQDAWLWAAGQNNRATAFQEQGIRTGGPAGTGLLAAAVTAYRAALEVHTRAEHPVEWAATQNNLGNTLNTQGIRTGGSAAADLLAAAVTAYRAALKVYTRAGHPVQWAGTQNNLGEALRNQGSRIDGPAGADLLDQAVTAYRAAMEVRTPAEHPVEWAMTQNNLAAVLGDQGTRTAGPAGADLLGQAVTAFRQALEVHTRADHPVRWAMTHQNIAITLLNRAAHDSTTDPRADLADAHAAVTAALEVFDPVHMSYNHPKATRLRDGIQSALDALP
jgi:tetratricopeptide (TPR) repeat protein